MPIRLGIDLSSVACRIVELDASRRSGRDGLHTRVRSFACLPREGAETHRRLSSLRRQPAHVVAWGLHADHRQALVERGSFRNMRRAAVTAARRAGVETQGRVADIAPAARRARGAATRSVIVTLAPTHELAAALRWLTGQGVRVASIVTPALALMSLARLRRDSASPVLSHAPDAYVALEERTTALALVRDGALEAACELDWGYQDSQGEARSRSEIATRLADETERFLAESGSRPSGVSQVCLCGGLPELRTMAIALMEQLDAEVETLDSSFAIDSTPEFARAHGFGDHRAELQLAWAVAADWPGPINLLRERERRLTKTVLTRAAVVAGVAAGVGVAWPIQRSDWWRSTVADAGPMPAQVANRSAPVSAGNPGPVRTRPERDAPVRRLAPPVEPQVSRPPAAVPPPPPEPIVRAESRQRQPQTAEAKAPVRLPAENQRQPVAERRTALARPEAPLPFDAALGTILYAPDRKLAIVDGRIVQVGDEVSGARVVDITPTSVRLRDRQGGLHILTLRAFRP